MAELALAIIPMGMKVASGLVSYLNTFNDRNDALARLSRQAEALDNTFQLLDSTLKRGQLDSATSSSAENALKLLAKCEIGLKELRDLEQKLSSTTTSHINPRTAKGSGQALNTSQFGSSKPPAQVSDIASNVSTDVKNLREPVSEIRSELPALQSSIDAIVPRIDLILREQFQAQFEKMQSSFQEAETTARQLYPDTSKQLSYMRSHERGTYLTACQIASKPSALVSVLNLMSKCSCRSRRLRRRKRLGLGPLHAVDEMISDFPHDESCDYYIPASSYERTRTCHFTGLVPLVSKAIEISFRSRGGAGAFSIGPSFTYFAMVDSRIAPAFGVLYIVSIAGHSFKNADETVSRTILEAARRKLQELFHSGKARPNDVETCHNTLLHCISVMINDRSKTLSKANSPFTRLVCEGLVNFLVTTGTPLAARDYQGSSALYKSVKSAYVPASIFTLLYTEGIEDYSQETSVRINPEDVQGLFNYYAEHPNIAETKELRNHRRQLRELARRTLSKTEFSRFQSPEAVLDVNAIEIDRLLRQKGIVGFGELSTFTPEQFDLMSEREHSFYSKSIYYDLRCPKDADLFFNLAFDGFCADHDYQSSLPTARPPGWRPFGVSIELDYAMWLQDHHVPLWRWSRRLPSPMPSVFVLADLAGMQAEQWYKPPGQDAAIYRVEADLSKTHFTDNCSCLCSPNGCTPFAFRMKWLAYTQYEFEKLTIQDYVSRFGSYVEKHGRDLNLSQYVTMVRQATFTALELTHTCLHRPGSGLMAALDPDEIEFEAQNVDPEVRNHLEDVVAGFQVFIRTGLSEQERDKGSIAQTTDPTASEEDLVYYQRAVEFWKSIWGTKVEAALRSLADGWNPNISCLEDLCISLTTEEKNSISREDEDDDIRLCRLLRDIEEI
ncbi:hypothetical protein FSARC_14916 [Fusarium sarcochroum]|uniref:Fungal N-terminal domain-containing protein n=1 Tax=Fusarium sarcochroum TaxID=1208366 RepID=A0A8H4SPS1_9HYPO|nr:hypothetical protein FSARC_14916 [Fusarium sarcochroum]